MKKVSFLLILLFFINIKSSFAMFSIDKTYLLLDDQSRNIDIMVFNSSNVSHDYSLSLIHYQQNTDGSYTLITNNTENIKFADPYLLFTPIKFTIPAKSSQMVRIQRLPMPEARDGEYTSYLLIKEAPNPLDTARISVNSKSHVQLSLIPIFNISVPLIVRKGDLASNVSIQQAVINNDRSNNKQLELTLARSGTKSIHSNIVVYLGNKVVGQLNGINIFLSADTRKITVALDNKFFSANKKNILNIQILDANTKEVLATQQLTL
ncbi:molecular chaperone [Rickettsiales bacterium LUAb2]